MVTRGQVELMPKTFGAIAAASGGTVIGSPTTGSPTTSPGGNLYDYLDTLSCVYWRTDETGISSPTDTLNASDGDADKAMALQAGTPTYGQTFSNYPDVKGISFDGSAWFKGPDNLDLSDSPLVSQGDETVIVFTNFSAFTGSSFHVLFSVTGDGGTSAYNTTSELFVGAADDFPRSRWQYSSGSTETAKGDATVPTGETILFAIRDITANEVTFYYDNAGTLTQFGSTISYTNDPGGGSSPVKAACFGGRNKTGNVKPMLSGQVMGSPIRADFKLSTAQMQEIIDRART